MSEVKPRDIIEFETTFGRVKCHDGDHVWFPRYFGENIAGQINGRKCFVALGFDAPLKYSELRNDYDKLKAENEKLKLQLEFTKQYLNPADTSFRGMIDTFNQLSDEQKEKITNLAKALVAL